MQLGLLPLSSRGAHLGCLDADAALSPRARPSVEAGRPVAVYIRGRHSRVGTDSGRITQQYHRGHRLQHSISHRLPPVLD